MSPITSLVLAAALAALWVFCMIVLSLAYHEVFYEPDPTKGAGWTRPKSSTDIVVFCWALAPLTLVFLIGRSLLSKLFHNPATS